MEVWPFLEHYACEGKLVRRKRKGFEDEEQEKEGVMYCSGAFDVPTDDENTSPNKPKRPKKQTSKPKKTQKQVPKRK